MFLKMFKFRGILTLLLLCILVIQIIDAGYTNEETDEKSKSLYSAVTSILGSTENSKHHHKETYDSPPCASGRCPSAGATYGVGNNPSGYVASSSQSSQFDAPPAGIATASGSIQPGNTNWGNNIHPQSPSSYGSYTHPGSAASYGSVPPMTHQAPGYAYGSTGSHGSVPQTATQTAFGPAGYNQPVAGAAHPGSAGSYGSAPPMTHQAPGYAYGSTGSYGSVPPTAFGSAGYNNQPAAGATYGHWNNHPGHNGYQGPRGYSVLDHSLKTKSEYTEVGSHNGPLQQAANGYGYGSGYGGYNGLFNRPNF